MPSILKSSASGGVDLRLRGWRPGMKKVRLTRTFREGGITLNSAARLTGEVLEGKEVRVRLAQFSTLQAAEAALTGIGVESVRPR